jgi:hypothetical protein
MYVRLLTGRYAGEERDIRADAARVMLADGRAELPFAIGGIVPSDKTLIVGERVQGLRLPASLAAKFEEAVASVGGSGTQHFHVSSKRKKA